MNGKIETIKLPEKYGVSLMSLPNGNLVYGTYGKVFLLNRNFKKIKSVKTSGDSFCAFNQRNEIYHNIYVSDTFKSCIILFDLNLNKLKQFDLEGAEDNQLNFPHGLCCHGDYLYICDYNNKRIQIITLDLDYSSTIQLDSIPPCRVQISNTTIGDFFSI